MSSGFFISLCLTGFSLLLFLRAFLPCRIASSIDGPGITATAPGDWDLTLLTCTCGGVNRVTVRCVLEK